MSTSRFFSLLGLSLFGWLIYRERESLHQFLMLARSINPLWLLLLALLQLIYYLPLTQSYRYSMRIFGFKASSIDIYPIGFVAMFLNSVVPSAGLAGIVPLRELAIYKKQRPAPAAIGYVFAGLMELMIVILMVIAIPLLLNYQGTIVTQKYNSALMLMLYLLLGFFIILYNIVAQTRLLLAVLKLIARWYNVINTHLNRPVLEVDWARDTHLKLHRYIWRVINHPRDFMLLLLNACLAHFILILTLALIITIFGAPASPPIVLTTYALMMFTWFVSPTPQGIGFVEAVGAITLGSFGFSSAVALSVPLIYRGFVQWLPLLIGFSIINRQQDHKRELAFSENWQVTMIAFSVAVVGIVNIVSALYPSLIGAYSNRLIAILIGIWLIIISQQLHKRKRVALWLSVTLLMTSGIIHLIEGATYVEALLVLVVAMMLITKRRYYYALSNKPTLVAALQTTIIGLFLIWLVGTFGLYLLSPQHYHQNFNLVDAGQTAYTFLFTLKNPHLLALTTYGRDLMDILQTTFVIIVSLGLINIFRPVLVKKNNPAAIQRAHKLLRQHGQSILTQLNTLPDRLYYLKKELNGVVPYITKGRYALALDDPVAEGREIKPLIENFVLELRQKGYEIVFYQTSAKLLAYFRRLKFKTLCIGHEAVVDLANFSLAGSEHKSIRNAASKLQRLGYRTQLINPPLMWSTVTELQSVSSEWLSNMRVREKQFSLGWFDAEVIRHQPVMTVVDETGSVMGFVNVLTQESSGHAGIDLMRYRNDCPNGTMELLISETILWAKNNHYRYFSLGLTPLYITPSAQTGSEKALGLLYESLNGLYGFKGLKQFKEKFTPDWVPRYLVYDSRSSLTAVTHTLLRASAGDSYLIDYLGMIIK